ncbi:MAG: 4a-hydroxytetrahydrobiopterin dehydratase [Chitinispirillaceae bacterium]
MKNSLNPRDEEELSGNLVNWNIIRNKDHKLNKSVKTQTYLEAVCALNEIAQLAQKEKYFPDILLSANKLIIELSAHSSGSLSEKDFIMAARIDEILEKLNLL